jgi:hypothetical protein
MLCLCNTIDTNSPSRRIAMQMAFAIGDNPRMSLRKALLIALALIVVVVGLYGLELAIPKRDYFMERHGTLVSADLSEASDRITGKYARGPAADRAGPDAARDHRDGWRRHGKGRG